MLREEIRNTHLIFAIIVLVIQQRYMDSQDYEKRQFQLNLDPIMSVIGRDKSLGLAKMRLRSTSQFS